MSSNGKQWPPPSKAGSGGRGLIVVEGAADDEKAHSVASTSVPGEAIVVSDPFPSARVIDTVGEVVPSSASPAVHTLHDGSAMAGADAPANGLAVVPAPERHGPAGDQGSFPPVDVDTAFFDGPPSPAESSLEIDTRDPRLLLKSTPLAARRRAHLTRYVTIAVALSTALCAAALVKAATSRAHDDDPGERVASATLAASVRTPVESVTAPAPTVAPVSPPAESALAVADPPATAPAPAAAGGSAADPPPGAAPAAVPSDPAPLAAAAAAPPSAASPEAPAQGTASSGVQAAAPALAPPTGALTAAQPAQPAHVGAPQSPEAVAAAAPIATAAQGTPSGPTARADAPATNPIATAPVAAADPRSAGREKDRARSALEAGRLGDAIAAGERSVSLDPGDAESWLILGAAYQSRGAFKDATRCFRSCVDQASHGAKGECAAMLRQR